MTGPAGWDAQTAIAALRPAPWNGQAWRLHRSKYEAIDATGSLRVSGRYNRGLDQFSEAEAWPALYLALRAETALGETIRHVTPQRLERLNELRLSELNVELSVVLDCRDSGALGLTAGHLVRDYDFEVTQELAAAAIAAHSEAILVPSATGLGDNLIVFPSRLHPASRLTVVEDWEPQLYVKR